MKSSSVYLKAAKLVDAGKWRFSCDAVFVAAGNSQILGSNYSDLFRPEGSDPYWGNLWDIKGDECQACRVLALCFMAAITEWEEKHER